MVERQRKGLFYNCDDKCFLKNKCKEQDIFMAIYKDVTDEEVETSLVEEIPPKNDTNLPIDPPEVELLISLHALTGFSTPKTLKLIGYINYRKFIILVDSGSTHNFIHHCIAQEINCYIFVIKKFQIMIINGSFMKCGGRCENVCL
jgi:hypothetical protein